MAFTVVPTKVSGDVWTEAMWDASLKDNLNAGVMRTLGDVTLAEDATSILFTDISPTNHKHLMLEGAMRAAGTSAVQINIAFDTDLNLNYDYQYLSVGATTTTAAEIFAGVAFVGFAVADGLAASGLYAGLEVWIPNFGETTGQKCYRASNAHKQSAVTGLLPFFDTAGFWRNSAAITSVMLYGGTFVAGSQFTLYGVGGTA